MPETLFWLEGAALVGVTIVGLNSTRRGAELAADIEHTDCAALLTDAVGAELLAETGTTLPTWVIGTPAYDAMLAPFAGAAAPDVDVPEDTRAVLIFTSGTTSAPKAAIRTHGALAQLGLNIAAAWEVTADDVAYNAMPWFHSNALYHATFPTIATGGTIAMRRRFSASGFIDDVRRFGATRFNYVGKVLEYILATPRARHRRRQPAADRHRQRGQRARHRRVRRSLRRLRHGRLRLHRGRRRHPADP